MSDPSRQDLNYFKLVSMTVGGALLLYWGVFHYLRHHVLDPIVGLVVGALTLTSVALFLVGKLHRKELPDDESMHAVVERYRLLLEEIRSFGKDNRGLLEVGLEPQLAELIEEKLPELLLRRDKYRAHWRQCDVLSVSNEVGDLEQRLTEEGDLDIQTALRRNLDIAQSTLANYRTLEKTLKLYDLQISSIEKHLENLQSKLHILDFDDDIKTAADEIIVNINGDIDDLEQALVSMDQLRISAMSEEDGVEHE